MPKRKRASRISRFRASTAQPLLVLAVMTIFGVTGAIVLRNSFAAPIIIKGRVYDTRTNNGIAGVVIFGCNSNGQTTTKSDGTWSLPAVNSGYCARVISGIPIGLSGPSTNNQPDYATSKTYEFQHADLNCYHNSTCSASEQTWDRSIDTGVDFRYTSLAPPPIPAPAPTPTPPAPPPAPTPTPKPTTGGTSKPSGSSAPAIPDKTPPSTPTGFSAVNNTQDKSISLTWQPSTDNVGVQGYSLERSENQQGWTQVADSITDTSYEDATVNFSTSYHYRIRAYDAANNYSDYAITDASSTNFQANVDPSNDSTINSDNGAFSINISSGTIDKPEFCVIAVSSSKDPPSVALSKVVAGPYDLTCRDMNGEILGEFIKPLALNIQLKKLNTKGVSGLSYYGYSNGQWAALKQTTKAGKDHVAHFDLGNSTAFVVMGKQKKTSAWAIVLITLLVIVSVLILAAVALRFMLRRKYQRQYDDYMKKIRGG